MPRIVSMIASATEIVDALGMLDSQVARSHECDYPARVRTLPVCTRPRIDIHADSREIDRAVKESARTSVSIYDVLDDVLDRAAPTHILTQIQCDVCAVSLRDVELALSRGLKTQPRIVSLQPDSLEAIWEDIRIVARALDIADRGEALISQKKAEMKALSRPRALDAPRVACIEWIEPLMAAGNWTPELIEMAGAVNLFGEAGRHSPWMTWEDLKASDPDVLLIAPCGFDLARTRQEMHWLTERPDWPNLRAVREGRVFLADGNQYFNRPGPRVVETFGIVSEILRFDAEEGIGWRRFRSAL
ncbi:MAG: ABC transporter substrate-binding protein [Bryobacteraceae bacterium]|jgi:iron complex transport system substrate-binding protein